LHEYPAPVQHRKSVLAFATTRTTRLTCPDENGAVMWASPWASSVTGTKRRNPDRRKIRIRAAEPVSLGGPSSESRNDDLPVDLGSNEIEPVDRWLTDNFDQPAIGWPVLMR
jgi:hypothetical protein